MAAPPIIQEVLRSPGQPLDPATRALMEPRFSHNFGSIRIHNDYRAAESALAVNALAYTVGRDVVFGAGQYTPKTHAGSRLLAHELAHVIQQERGGPVAPPLRNGMLEQDADAAAAAFVAGSGPILVGGASAPGLALQPRSLSTSLDVRQLNLNDVALEEEITLLREWLNANPADRYLLPELERLEAVALRRSERADKKDRIQNQIQAVVDAVNAGRIPKWLKVFPFRPSQGLFRMDVAPIMAWRKGDMIHVQQPVTGVKQTDMFKKDARTLPGDVFTNKGLALKPKELVGVRLYDEGEKVVVVFAEQLLEFAEASDDAVLLNIAIMATSVVGGPVVGKLGGRALGALSGAGQKLGQRVLMSATLGTAEAVPSTFGQTASSALFGSVGNRAVPAIAQQAVGQTAVRAGTQAVVQSSVRAGAQTIIEPASRVGASLLAPASTIGGIASTQVAGEVAQQMIPRHARGYGGEQGMGFEHYSEEQGWIIVEGPSGGAGHQATAKGFDGLAYNARRDLLDIVDNKSLGRAGNVSSATAIDPAKNLGQNLDAAIQRIAGMPNLPNRGRILELLRAQRQALTNGTPFPSQVRLVVRHVGGRTTGVTDALARRGLQTPP